MYLTGCIYESVKFYGTGPRYLIFGGGHGQVGLEAFDGFQLVVEHLFEFIGLRENNGASSSINIALDGGTYPG